MKIFLNILQALLGLWTLTGAVYMMGHYEVLASSWAYNTLPAPFWILLGIVEIVLGGVLLAGLFMEQVRQYVVPSAIGLAFITLAGILLYGAYAGLAGALWAVVPAVLLFFIAYKRGLKAKL